MTNIMRSRRTWVLGLVMLLGAASLAFAQFGGAGAAPAGREFTQQEIQADALVKTCNDLSKQNWEVFQVIPIWKVTTANGETEMVPARYQVLGRRPVK